MKKLKVLVVLFIIALTAGIAFSESLDGDEIFQVSVIDALLVGVYDGDTTFAELAEHGSMGLGTFNGLDGEMIALDGIFYRIRADGKAYPVAKTEKTPFAVVTFFLADIVENVGSINSYDELKEALDGLVPSDNIFYAIKVEGEFDYVKTRSVPAQTKPYPPLAEVVEHQSVFEFNNVKGTILGFRAPPFVKGVNVPGYHLHFITEDRSAGGHLLACSVNNARIKIDSSAGFRMILPDDKEFLEADLSEKNNGDLDKVEKDVLPKREEVLQE